jgi:hypothetical protein
MADQNFSLKSGDSKSVAVNIVNGSGVAQDVSSAAAVVYRMAESPSGEALISKSLSSGVEVSTSTVTITFAPLDTAELGGNYYHELEITDDVGNVYTVLTGHVLVEGDLIV